MPQSTNQGSVSEKESPDIARRLSVSATFDESVLGSVRYTERKQKYRDARLSIKKDTMSGKLGFNSLT